MSPLPPDDHDAERAADPTPGRNPEERRHEMLCAYLLGELEDEERTEIEAALEESEELRAERARLESTIGVVQNAFPEEGLSPEALAELMSAATKPNRSVPPGWSLLRGGGGLVRLAAAVVVLLGAAVAVRWFTDFSSTDAPDSRGASTEVAQAPRPAGEGVEGISEESFEEGEARDLVEQAGAAEAEVVVLDPETLAKLQALGYVAEGAGGGQYRGPGDSVPSEEFPEPTVTAGGAIAKTKEADAADVLSTVAQTATSGAAPGSSGPTSPGPPGSPPTRRSGTAAEPAAGTAGRQLELQMRAGEPAQDPTADLRGRKEQLFQDSQDLHLGELELQLDGDKSGEAEEYARARKGLEGLSEELVDAEVDRFFLGRGVTAVPREEQIEAHIEEVLAWCRPYPGETPSAMFFRLWGDNPFELTALDAKSTFAVDVDTASYALARRYLTEKVLPEKAQIRTEEFVNYFRADEPAPVPGEVFEVYVEMAPSLFHPDPRVEMLRVTVRGKDVDEVDRQPLALTFVVDVSGSMKEGGRLELVKHALLLLVRELDSADAIALITFSEEARVVSAMTSASARGRVEDVLYGLDPDRGTNIEAGLMAGYQLAVGSLTPNAVNRVILLSDGVGNIGETDQERILAKVAEHQAGGIYLNTIGVGMGNHNDVFLEQLADKGDGICNYIDSEREARKVMVDDFTKTLQPIARDVKIQVEFDPAQVESYRQLGYENRAMADADFRRDEVDAGEVNAGHQVTALYEIVRLPARADTGVPLARVNLRYKPQNPIDAGDTSRGAYEWAEKAKEMNRSFFARDASPSFASTNPGYRRSVLVAQFAEFLRRSVHARGDSLTVLAEEALRLSDQLQDPDFVQFCDLLLTEAIPLLQEERAAETDELYTAVESLKNRQFEANRDALNRLRPADAAEREDLEDAPSVALDDKARVELDRLESEVRGLIRDSMTPPPEAAREDGDR